MKAPFLKDDWKMLFMPQKYGSYINLPTLQKLLRTVREIISLNGYGIPNEGYVSLAELDWRDE